MANVVFIAEQTAQLEGWQFKPTDVQLLHYLNRYIAENEQMFRPLNVRELTQHFVFSLPDSAYIPIGDGVWYFFSGGPLSDAWEVSNATQRKVKEHQRLLGIKRYFTVEQQIGDQNFSWQISEYHTTQANEGNWVLVRIRKLRLCSACYRPLTNRPFVVPDLNELPPDLNDQVPPPNDEVQPNGEAQPNDEVQPNGEVQPNDEEPDLNEMP